jgi:ABC-type Fe3+/spermidine/putrescine transport system ATPase subunit
MPREAKESMAASAAPAVEVEHLRAGYGKAVILDGVDLRVAPGEFVAILGSSGCGKTTLLRTIAGFQKAMGGKIRSFGRDMSGLPPEKRDVAMVFQSYALWPHMTVLGNMGYGLRLRGMPRDEIRTRVGKVLAMLNMSGLEDRKVTNLSGGQRQRVALGRALAVEPRLLLLDEPMSNLDAKVRIQVRAEIKTLQKRLGFAALHVTHDREEAMTMADRIVVMDQGRIAQLGTPEDVYHRPTGPFVAAFMGADNSIDLEIGQGPSGMEIKAGLDHAASKVTEPAPTGLLTGYFRDDLTKLVDPDHRADNEITLKGTIALRSYPGGHYRYAIAVGDKEFTVKDSRSLEAGTKVGLSIPVRALHLFPREMTATKPN